MLQADPTLAQKPLQVLAQWESKVDPRTLPLLLRWETIIRERLWSEALAETDAGNQLRQASPLGFILPEQVRLEILGRYRTPEIRGGSSCPDRCGMKPK